MADAHHHSLPSLAGEPSRSSRFQKTGPSEPEQDPCSSPKTIAACREQFGATGPVSAKHIYDGYSVQIDGRYSDCSIRFSAGSRNLGKVFGLPRRHLASPRAYCRSSDTALFAAHLRRAVGCILHLRQHHVEEIAKSWRVTGLEQRLWRC
jgi:hypothetical protein